MTLSLQQTRYQALMKGFISSIAIGEFNNILLGGIEEHQLMWKVHPDGKVNLQLYLTTRVHPGIYLLGHLYPDGKAELEFTTYTEGSAYRKHYQMIGKAYEKLGVPPDQVRVFTHLGKRDLVSVMLNAPTM